MTSERAQAYGRVMKTLENMGAAKLLDSELDRIRAAADTLFFCDDAADSAARDAVADISELEAHLVESGRWLEETAEQLRDDVFACGPVISVA